MKITLKNLFFIAVLSFTVSFATGMSASLMYQEHQSLKPFMTTQQMVMDELSAETETIDFS